MSKEHIIAIMGPSGAGKTTLADNLVNRLNLAVPHHCTTRSRRMDDKEDFYRFLTHEEYQERYQHNEFLISSGDGKIIRKEYGNFYGVLKTDCQEAFQQSNTIILLTSYKDILQLVDLKKTLYDINIVNLTFTNIEQGVFLRLKENPDRNHTEEDIHKRIENAIKDNETFCDQLKQYADATIYTDYYNIEETYNQVVQKIYKK